MKIFLNRQGQNLGTFTPAEVRAGYSEGRFNASDLAWQDGMPMWKPLGEVIDDIAPGEGGSAPPALVEECEPAWERRNEVGILAAAIETLRGVLLQPSATFARLKLRGGFGAPLVFFIIVQMVGIIATEAYNWGIRAFNLPGMFLPEKEAGVFAAQMGSTLGSLQWIVIAPVIMVAAAFVGAAMTHVALMLVGGAKRPYEATFRVYAYVTGAVALFNLIPCCGWLIAFVWGIVAETVGLSEVHQIGRGRALLAVLLPLIVCCGLLCAVGLAAWLAMGPSFFEALNNNA